MYKRLIHISTIDGRQKGMNKPFTLKAFIPVILARLRYTSAFAKGLRRDKTARQAGIHVLAQIIAGMTSFLILRFSGSKKYLGLSWIVFLVYNRVSPESSS